MEENKVKEAVEEKVEEVKEAAEEKVEEVKAAAEEKVEEVKEAVEEKVEEVKEAAEEKVEEVKAVAEEKVEEVKEAAEEKVEEVKAAAEEKVEAVEAAYEEAATEAAPVKSASNALSIIALICGIISIVCCYGVSVITGPAAIICGVLGKKKCPNKKMAKIGMILGIVGIVLGVIIFVGILALGGFTAIMAGELSY